MKDTVTEVVAALIWEDGRFLICRRPAHKARGLLWEFAGGKVEPGETGPQALIRECREELGIEISVGDVFAEVTHAYPDLTVHLTLFNAGIKSGVPEMREHCGLRWITAGETARYDFCPADREIIEKLGGVWKNGFEKPVRE
ncbi:8-oxo-dGTP diphosphatase [Papillibacter cinnamivorans DSM 12816]|uniref:8-oxo-dGTP diphosphatase n=1 Tax=Papillibacter cinnamivorans DSM 12816 TaxID=1122930 RepID=A0A1W2ASK2_9FIRM|nr:8-oxo-dGTP diphosphatase [Papillibacter cinnamivorans DSM 12816]